MYDFISLHAFDYLCEISTIGVADQRVKCVKDERRYINLAASAGWILGLKAQQIRPCTQISGGGLNVCEFPLGPMFYIYS